MIANLILISIFLCASTFSKKIDPAELKCLVCQATTEELHQALKLVDPSIKVDVGGYQLDADGNYQSKTIPKAMSEIHLSELIDGVCEKMDNYVRATWKTNGTLTLLNLFSSGGTMNAQMSDVDIIQDDDLNKSLQYYCSSIIEENEDDFIKDIQENRLVSICDKIGLCAKKSLPEKEL